jgi:endothelin-converting enzyme/putative endopeptidase
MYNRYATLRIVDRKTGFFLGFFLYLALPAGAHAQERPLMSLPYTPSLEPAFIDRAVDPCQDFFHYACGNWIRMNPIPADQPRWDVYGKLQVDNQRFLWGILSGPDDRLSSSVSQAGRTANEQKIGDYFGACMDEAAVEKAGIGPLRQRLDEIAALKRLADLPPLLGRLHLQTESTSPLFGFGSAQDFEDSTRVIAFASASGLGLPDRDYYVKDDAKSQETRARYMEHVTAMFHLLGDSDGAAKTGAQTVMAIETALARASLTRVDKRDPYKLFHKMTRAQLVKLTPSFGWGAYWKAVALAAPDRVNVTEPEFFKEVDKQLRSRSLADWKVYLRWHLAHAESAYLSSAFVKANFDFYSRYLRGVAEMQPRWKRCVRFVDRDLGEALGQVFVARTFQPDTKSKALAITQQIEKAMEADLSQLTWMGEETRKQALVKLRGVVNKIGYPDPWRDYSGLQIVAGDFVGNVDRSVEFESKRQLRKIGQPVDRKEWDMTPPTVDADYNPQMNDINFPAGVLQPPLFDSRMDDAPNYGNTGATIGHELTHGFDDEGRQFDAAGNLRDWWTKKDADEFVKRASCIADQYSQYTVVDDIKINGKLTLGEDTADLGGTILAYLAWKDATRGQDLQPIGGFTPDQRFFIGMAQWACGDERPESKRVNAVTNPHSPNEYRINGVVSNMPEFAKAFSCRAGQKMVREQLCRVW